MKAKRWAPNPYALAQLIADRRDIEFLYKADGETVDKFLEQIFGAQHLTVSEAVQLFQAVAESVVSPMSLSEVLELAEAKRAAQFFSRDQLARVLKYLVELTDMNFEPAIDESLDATGSVQTWMAELERLMIDDASYLDPIQGAVGNCYLISAMIALAWARPPRWTGSLQSTRFDPPRRRVFSWTFHNGRGREPRPVQVSGRIPVKAGRKPRYARAASGEAWPGLIEKAYVVKIRPAVRSGPAAEPTLADYQSIDRKTIPTRACQSLAGGRVQAEILDDSFDLSSFFVESELMRPSGVARHPAMAWTKEDIGVKDKDIWKKTGLWPNHAYAVLGVMPSKHVVLRNPHGVATKPRKGYAEGKWQPHDNEEVVLNENGVFAISSALFKRNFENMGWIDRPPRS